LKGGCSSRLEVKRSGVKKIEAKLNFDVAPRVHQIIAVDENVVKCGGRPLYVWVAVDAYTKQPIWFGVS